MACFVCVRSAQYRLRLHCKSCGMPHENRILCMESSVKQSWLARSENAQVLVCAAQWRDVPARHVIGQMGVLHLIQTLALLTEVHLAVRLAARRHQSQPPSPGRKTQIKAQMGQNASHMLWQAHWRLKRTHAKAYSFKRNGRAGKS